MLYHFRLWIFVEIELKDIENKSQHLFFCHLGVVLQEKKKKKTFLTLLKIFFHPIKGFNPKVDGASTFLILVCLKWANLMLLFKTACYFSWSVCLFSGPVLSSYCLF